MTRAVESNAHDARTADQSILAELEGWAERMHRFAMATGACALEELDDDPTRAETHRVMSGTYSTVHDMLQRRIAEIRADGWDGPV
jgi:hypothetical protein